jgi:hypothetical protein
VGGAFMRASPTRTDTRRANPEKCFSFFPGVFPSKFAGCLLMNEGQRSPLRVRWPVPETK